jgi:hypothetical protein
VETTTLNLPEREFAKAHVEAECPSKGIEAGRSWVIFGSAAGYFAEPSFG